MRLNESTALVNDRVVLRPYRRWHVPRYSEWMGDEALREATASERLTLDEEYAMQRACFDRPDRTRTYLLNLSLCLQSRGGSTKTVRCLLLASFVRISSARTLD